MIDLFMQKMTVLWSKARVFWKKLVPVLLASVGVLGVVLFVLLFVVMFNECVEYWAKMTLGVEHKREVIEFIGWGIAGILGFFGAIAVNRRADAQVKIAKSQLESAAAQVKIAESQLKDAEAQIRIAESQVKVADAQVQAANAQVENNTLIERGHIQERFKTAVEHLGNEQVAARIASFHEFYYLARDNNNLRENIFDTLCAHLRQVTSSETYGPKIKLDANKKNPMFTDNKDYFKDVKPTEEVRILLGVLFQPKGSQNELIFKGLQYNLREIFLMGAELQSMRLQKMNLQNVNLQKAILWGTNLQGTDLIGAGFQYADFQYADLQDADLRWADLRGTNLQRVKNLETVKLSEAKVKGAIPPEGFEWPEDVNHD